MIHASLNLSIFEHQAQENPYEIRSIYSIYFRFLPLI